MQNRNIIIIAALIVYMVSSVYNTGFYYYDEHYQLVEFAELKAGNNTPLDLAWEYDEKIRSAIQPGIVFVLFSTLRAIHISDPYILMLALRLLTASVAIIIITYFARKTEHLVHHEYHTWYKLLTYFLWFLPFINVRFSSESYSGLTFLLGVAFYFSENKHKYLLVGITFGLSFLFRFQTAIMSLGFLAWLVLIQKTEIKSIIKICQGGFIVLCCGFFIDWWFYNQPVAAFINYYVSNIINDVASDYGTSPWYYYFLESTQKTIIPIGLIIWTGLFIGFNKNNFINWVIVPFLIIHLLTPHKELRFLFPIVNFIPLAIILSLQQWIMPSNLSQKNWVYYLRVTTLLLLIITNLLALLLTVFSPADKFGRMNITQSIHCLFKNQKVILWAIDVRNPYKPIAVNQRFYLDDNVEVMPLDFTQKNLTEDAINLILVKTKEIKYYTYFFERYRLKKIKDGIPLWIQATKDIFGYENSSLSLYQITMTKHALDIKKK
jgi:phosphatidylinositol glycan class B